MCCNFQPTASPIRSVQVLGGEGNNACLTDEGRKLITKDFN
jgi:hypothetical protein